MDLKEIQNLIKFVANSGVAEVKLEMDDVKITIRTTLESTAPETPVIHTLPTAPIAIPQVPQQTITATVPVSTPEENPNYITIKSPMIGTFYRKASPDKPSFVELGSSFAKGDTLCVIEAMKLFNEIEADCSGKIIKILVDDMSPVEYNQPLFLIDPS